MKTNETKNTIIEAGTQAMIEKSYNSVGLNEILKSVNIPKGSFYHYFKSKEELGVSVIEKSSDEHAKRLRDFYTNRKKGPIERLRDYFEASRDHSVEIGFKNKCLVSKLALEVGCLSDPMRNAIKYGVDQWRLATAQCIQEGQDKGEITKEYEADALAEYLIASWEGVLIRSQVTRDKAPLDQFIDVTFNKLLKDS